MADYKVAKEVVETKPEPVEPRFEIKFLKEVEGADGKLIQVVSNTEKLSLKDIDVKISNAQVNADNALAEKKKWEAIKVDVKALE